MIDCDHFKKPMEESLCLAKHHGAIGKKAFMEKRGSSPGFQPCLACPEAIRMKEENMSSKRGECVECKKDRAIIAHGKCWSCYGKERAEKGEVAKKPVAESAVSKKDETKTMKSETITAKQETARVFASEDTASRLTIDTRLTPGLLEKLNQMAADNLRTAESQALWILREALTRKVGVSELVDL